MENIKESDHFKYCLDIIDGNCLLISGDVSEIKEKIAEWLKFQETIFDQASWWTMLRRCWYMKRNRYQAFDPFFSNDPPERSLGSSSEIFIKDAFTDPFPSTHDLDDWALSMKIADIFILKGITPKSSSDYFIHIKNQFVNHRMVRGIIQFDVYHVKSY